jgi:hypothetical protein
MYSRGFKGGNGMSEDKSCDRRHHGKIPDECGEKELEHQNEHSGNQQQYPKNAAISHIP